jgi:hypothetical protein
MSYFLNVRQIDKSNYKPTFLVYHIRSLTRRIDKTRASNEETQPHQQHLLYNGITILESSKQDKYNKKQ